MDTDVSHDAPADESFLLGMIAGCCNENPRDEEMLAVLVEQLRMAQRRRRMRMAPQELS